jgi:hypothetical protein
VVTELPYQVNKARLAEKIADLVRTGRLKDVADVKDHSSGREGMRLVIELKRGANPQVVLNQLYKHTQLQDSFGVIMLSLVDGVPRTLNLAEMIGYYVDHQIDVVTRRTRYELKKAEERDHIVKAADRARQPRRGHQPSVVLTPTRRGRTMGVQATGSRRTTSWTCRCAASRVWRERSSSRSTRTCSPRSGA